MTSIYRLFAATVLGATFMQPGFSMPTATQGLMVAGGKDISNVRPNSAGPELIGSSKPHLLAQMTQRQPSPITPVPPSSVPPAAIISPSIPSQNAVMPPAPAASNSTVIQSGGSELRGPMLAPGTGSYTSGAANNQTGSASTIEAPRVGPAVSNTAGQVGSSLTGLANITSVTANASALARLPLPRLRDTEVQFVQVSLRNDSQQVAVINGDASQGTVGATNTPAVGGRYLVQSAKPGLTKKKVEALVLVSAGTFGLAWPIFHEYIEPTQNRDRSLGEAIGVDGTRHRVEADRFGVRVLMPGDESVGWMAFACDPTQSIKTVTIPLSFSRSLTPDGVLEVPVKSGDNIQPQNSAVTQQAATQAIQDAKKSAQDSGAPKPVPGGDGGMMQDQTIPGQPSTTNPGQ